MKKILKLLAPALVLVGGIVLVQVLVAAKPEPDKKDEDARPVSLYVDEVKSELVTVSVKTQGEVRPKTEIDLIPQVSGRIVAMSESFNEGAEFAPDSMLLKIDDADYQVAAVRAEARVAEAQTALERELAFVVLERDVRGRTPRRRVVLDVDPAVLVDLRIRIFGDARLGRRRDSWRLVVV